ncbi:MAG: signal peptidase I [Bacilli bacterium]|nr:signal peptidase I [Bacilli bacterium]
MLKFINKIFQIFIDILVFIITVLILFLLYNFVSIKILHNNYTNTFGYTIFEVASGSMQPAINQKDLIIVKITDKIKLNDIITYKIEDDFITHRIIKIDGDTIYTKGDANTSEDYQIKKDKLIGKVVYVIPKFGFIKEIFFTPKIVISIIIVLILFSFCFSYVPEDKRKTKKEITLSSQFDDIDINIIKK